MIRQSETTISNRHGRTLVLESKFLIKWSKWLQSLQFFLFTSTSPFSDGVALKRVKFCANWTMCRPQKDMCPVVGAMINWRIDGDEALAFPLLRTTQSPPPCHPTLKSGPFTQLACPLRTASTSDFFFSKANIYIIRTEMFLLLPPLARTVMTGAPLNTGTVVTLWTMIAKPWSP